MSFDLRDKHPITPIKDERLRTQVFTHRSATEAPARLAVDREPARDNERLALLGSAVIELLVTAVIECNMPLSRVGEISDTRMLLVTRERMATWADAYGLPQRLIVNPAQRALIPNNENAKAQVFQAYVGALYKDQGIDAVEEWFSPVLDDAVNEIEEIRTAERLEDNKSWRNSISSQATTESFEPAAAPHEPLATGRGSTPAARSPPSGSGSSLSYFNERCSKLLKGAQPIWQVKKDGKDHTPEFTATVTLPGEREPIGIGVASNSKLAKQRAATVALAKLPPQ